jgi:mRNA interferase MazF
MQRGEIWWADLGRPTGSGPAKRRPVLVVQSDAFNASRIGTVMVAVITSNLRLADAPGNVRIPKRTSGLGRDSVVNVSHVATLDRSRLTDRVSALGPDVMERIGDGLRLGLGL